MKKTFSLMWFIAIPFMLSIVSCNKDNGPENPPVSKGDETVQNIVQALEDNEEVSGFVEVLKKINLPDINEDKLTVFAVKNLTAAKTSRSTMLDSVSIKRHIAVGSYSKSQLTDGLVLKSVNDENLYISRTGDDVAVNGVEIEGEEIAVGNSFVYVVPEVFESIDTPIIREDSLIAVRDLWNYEMKTFADQSFTLEASLTMGQYGTFNEITILSERYWNTALNAIRNGEKYLAQIADMESAKGLSDTITLDLALVKAQMFAYYGTYISDNRACKMGDYEAWCNKLIAELPTAMSNASSLLLAKASLCNAKYDEAKNLCKKLIASGMLKLSDSPYIYEPENLWRGYDDIIMSGDGGLIPMYPLLSREAYLIEGLAEYGLGNTPEAIKTLSILNTAYQGDAISGDGNININIFLFYMRSTGGMYPYYRILTNMNNMLDFSYPEVKGFDESKHLLLPIPESALKEFAIEQNPDY